MAVKAEMREAFITATLSQTKESINRGIGCHRVDLLEGNEIPSRSYLYECYEDEEAESESERMPHFERWWPRARDMLVRPSGAAQCNAAVWSEDLVADGR